VVGFDNIPVVGLSPDVDEIVQKVEHFIKNPHDIEIYGKASISHVRKYHDCNYVAQLYCNSFQRFM